MVSNQWAQVHCLWMVQQDKSGVTPLHEATRNGHFDVCQLIFNNIEDKNPECFFGTPFDIAGGSGHAKIFEMFLEYAPEKNPLCRNTHILGGSLIHQGGYSGSLLHQAADMGYLKICQLIIEHTDNKNPKDAKGLTPLHIAAKRGHLSICNLILENITEKNPKDDNNDTPLVLAIQNCHWDVCSLLLDKNEKVSMKEQQLLLPYFYKHRANKENNDKMKNFGEIAESNVKDLLKPDKIENNQEMVDLKEESLKKLQLDSEKSHIINKESTKESTKSKTCQTVYVQSGQGFRGSVSKIDFEGFVTQIKLKIGELVLTGNFDQTKPIKFSWYNWYEGRGIIVCENEESADFLIEMAKNTTYLDKKFYAWKMDD